jgi:peptidoglycan/xylan/chitin deacetylase (PgdA/CDA1 family)
MYYSMVHKDLYEIKPLFSNDNPYWNFYSTMNLENKYGAKSTFFFLNESLKINVLNPKSLILSKGRYNINSREIKSIIREIDSSGWEIGLHGSYLSYDDVKLLQKEKIVLEEIVGHTVNGVRQHYLNINIPKTWKIQESIGLKYDSTFGLKNNVGVHPEYIKPFKPFKRSKFIVFPLVIMDGYLSNVSNSEEEAMKIVDELIKVCKSKKAILSVLWHNRSLNKQEFPFYWNLYEYILKTASAEKGEFILPMDIIMLSND